MNIQDYKGVFVYAQQVDNELSGIALELVGKGKDLAKDLGTEVTAVLIGSGVKALADELAEYGADKVIVVDDPELAEYRTEPYTHALASVIKEFKPEIVLVGATAIGRDLGPRVSARIHTGLTADCTQLDIGDFPINPIPGKEQLHNQLLIHVLLLVVTQSQQSLVPISVLRWQPFVPVLCRKHPEKLVKRQLWLNTIPDLHLTIST